MKYTIRTQSADVGPVSATLDGIDQPRAKVVFWMQIEDGPQCIVLRVPGYKYFSGLGRPWHYAPAQFQVYTIQKREGVGDDTVIEATRIAEFGVKSYS